MGSRPIPFAKNWFWLERYVLPIGFCYALQQKSAEYHWISWVNSSSWAHLVLPLSRENLCIRSRYSKICMSTCLVMRICNIPTEWILGSLTAVVWSLLLIIPLSGKSNWNIWVRVHDYIFLLKRKPRFCFSTNIKYFICLEAKVCIRGSSICCPCISEYSSIHTTSQRSSYNLFWPYEHITIRAWCLSGIWSIIIPFIKIIWRRDCVSLYSAAFASYVHSMSSYPYILNNNLPVLV